jgi:hypothetical protein
MKWVFAILLGVGIAFTVHSVPPRTAARVAARTLRASWDWVASVGAKAAREDRAVRSERRASRKAQAATPQSETGRRGASREGIVPQPPKETLHPSDRAALDSLLAEPAQAGTR